MTKAVNILALAISCFLAVDCPTDFKDNNDLRYNKLLQQWDIIDPVTGRRQGHIEPDRARGEGNYIVRDRMNNRVQELRTRK